MSEAIRAILDAVTDRVLSFRPAEKGQQAKKIQRRVKRQRKEDGQDDRESSMLQAEVERLRRLTAGQWFYADGYDGEACCFSPAEVLDNLDLKPGRHVVRVDVATPLPSIWLAVHVRTNEEMDADETDDREAFTEHATEAEATTALEPRP